MELAPAHTTPTLLIIHNGLRRMDTSIPLEVGLVLGVALVWAVLAAVYRFSPALAMPLLRWRQVGHGDGHAK